MLFSSRSNESFLKFCQCFLVIVCLFLRCDGNSNDFASDDTANWSVLSRDGKKEPWGKVDLCAYDDFHFHVQFEYWGVKQKRDQSKPKGRVSKGPSKFRMRLVQQIKPTLEEQTIAKEVVSIPFEPEQIESERTSESYSEATENANVPSSEEKEDEEKEVPPDALECELDPDFCIPKLISIRLPELISENETLKQNHTMLLGFETSTNQPLVKSKEDIERFISFKGYIADEMTGTWEENGRTLKIRIVKIDQEKVKTLKELMQTLIQTTLKLKHKAFNSEKKDIQRVLYSGDAHFRIGAPGRYHLEITGDLEASSTDSIPIESPVFEVRSCHEGTVVVPHQESLIKDASKEKEAIPRSSYTLKGMISHAGREGLTLPNATIDMEEPGTWSMSFWVYITKHSIGNFRTLFFKGNGTGDHRTPSAWLKPNENKLVLRVSSTAGMDVGLDSKSALPLNKWTHLGFSFLNCSTTVDQETAVIRDEGLCKANAKLSRPWYYALRFFINGDLDRDVFIYAPVLPNDGPLHIGKSPWADGMQGFVSNLRLFPGALTQLHHKSYYLQDKKDHMNFDPNLFKPSAFYGKNRKILNQPTNQIAYLQQFFPSTLEDKFKDEQTANSGMELVSSQNLHNMETVGEELHQRALQLAKACSTFSQVWDILREAADLGNPRALRDVGTGYLYGFLNLEGMEQCQSESGTRAKEIGFPVEHSVSKSIVLLKAALARGQLDAAKPLALAIRIDRIMHANVTDPLMDMELGLYHLAAAGGRLDAFAILARRYRELDAEMVHALGSLDKIQISAYHYYHAALDASVAYHEKGKQPLHEMNRLYDGLTNDLTKGQLGDDDELIQYQKMRADKDGDVDAMAAMGDLYYWGARGMPRDHAQAYHYFKKAATAGHVASQSALAGMLLKGEGTDQDNQTAIEWYEKAAEKNNTRALNGLGFIHFYGSGGMEMNKTLALEFFERAARNEEDGDSIFNAGYCHAMGLGTSSNISQAMTFYELASRKFGHFDAIFEMGKVYMTGSSCAQVPRNPSQAIDYLKAAAEAGRWGKCVRQGFELFLANQYTRAAILYHEASEYGYPVATSNLAYLYDVKMLTENDLASEKRALGYLLKSADENQDKEVLSRIGDYHFYGLGGLKPDPKEALRWYSRASAEGVDVGAYNVGHMYEYGLGGVERNLERADRYYRRVIELNSERKERKLETLVVAYLALFRLSARKWLEEMNFLAPPHVEFTSDLTSSQEEKLLMRNGSSPGDGLRLQTSDYHQLTLLLATLVVGTTGLWYIFHAQKRNALVRVNLSSQEQNIGSEASSVSG